MKQFRCSKKLAILSTILLIDIITKLLAVNILPFEQDVFLFKDKIGFYLIYNEGSTGAQANYLLKYEQNKNLALVLAAASLTTLLIYTIFIRRIQIKTLYKWLLGIEILIICIALEQLLKAHFSDFEISNWTTSVIAKIPGLALYFLLHERTKNNYIKLFTLIIISGGLANLLNHFYYPYKIIDFIQIEGLYDLCKLGIFNFADIAIDIGILGLLVSLLMALTRRIAIFVTSKPTKPSK